MKVPPGEVLGATNMSQQYRDPKQKTKKTRRSFENVKNKITPAEGRIEGATRRGLGATKMSRNYSDPKQIFFNHGFFEKLENLRFGYAGTRGGVFPEGVLLGIWITQMYFLHRQMALQTPTTRSTPVPVSDPKGLT